MKELLLDAKELTEESGNPITREVKSLTNKRTMTLNLLHRLKKYHRGVLLFFNHEGVPFDNNQAERDLRMMITREKIISGYGSSIRAKKFCDLRSIISSFLKQNQNILQTLAEMIEDPR